ncbi:MAG: peptidylprolyl isomerase [Frankiales bacterium]|nr:peptidylprolyl isomerase [Frankiales bacterium]
MTRRTTTVGLVLCFALSACGGSSTPSFDSLSSPTPTTGCTPSGSGTTDLTKKPEIKVPTGTAPTETTTSDIVCGKGVVLKDGMKVDLKYVGVFLKDGKEFDSSWSRGNTTLPLTVGTGVIPGFSKGLAGMRVGGRREVIIPSKDGYGAEARGPIPANSDLVFVIDVVSVHKAAPSVPCKASGTGTTDLKKKPVVVPPKAAAPTTTTYTDIVCGNGAQADVGSEVQVRYLGVLYKGGKEFDSSWSRGFADLLPVTVGSGVIAGFSTGLTGMKVGGRREILIPPSEGYGVSGNPPAIPGGASLIFVIDLVSVA